jgi:hypothetical protein
MRTWTDCRSGVAVQNGLSHQAISSPHAEGRTSLHHPQIQGQDNVLKERLASIGRQRSLLGPAHLKPHGANASPESCRINCDRRAVRRNMVGCAQLGLVGYAHLLATTFHPCPMQHWLKTTVKFDALAFLHVCPERAKRQR